MLLVELFVHGWDFAKATSQPFEPSPALAGYMLEVAHEVVRPELRDGDAFAEEVVVCPGASHLEQVIAFTGRLLA